MLEATEDGLMVKYQFEIDDERWDEWKNTVPRSKSLEERIIELIEADTEGRVRESREDDIANTGSSEDATETVTGDGRTDTEAKEEVYEELEKRAETLESVDEETRSHLREELAGSGDTLDARVDETLKMYDYLREHGSAEKDDLLDVVDVDATGYASRNSVWSNMVKGKDTLRALPGVEKPESGRTEWTYTGETGE